LIFRDIYKYNLLILYIITMAKHTKRYRKHPKHPKMMGGGVAENAIAVYGGIGQQHAAQGMGNVIAMNPVGGSVAANVMPLQSGGGIADGATLLTAPAIVKLGGENQHMQPMHGGNQLEQLHQNSQEQQGGKTVIADLLVPAGLLYASQRMLKKSMKKKGGKKGGRKSRRNKRSHKRR
jgi:hypothetical protein